MPVTKVRTKWSSGALVFYEATSGVDLMTVDPTRQYEYDEVPLSAHMSSADVANSTYMVAPHSGVIRQVRIVPLAAACANLSTVFTIYVSAVSAGTVHISAGTASGTVCCGTFSAAVDKGGLVRVASDGAQVDSLPVCVAAVLRR